MAMNRALFAKQLEPGLNALFGLEYKNYPEQWKDDAVKKNYLRIFNPKLED